jgi:hypothetical protein
VPVAAGLLVAWGVFGLLRDRSSAATAACPAGEAACATQTIADLEATRPEAAPVLASAAACNNVGYLCAELVTDDRIQLRRWKDFSGTIVVYVPRPDFEDRGEAARLQEAAGRGLRAWNGQPFQILPDYRGDREAHFAVEWTRTLPGSRIGVARTQWSPGSGLQVLGLQLSTRSPYDPSRLLDERQVQLTAAHEMGHALGLQHSDSESDVMYPSNTAVRISARDYRTMEVLYELEDGTEIVR